MAPVNGKPFLHYLFVYLKGQGVRHAILSVGYKAETIRSYFGDTYLGISIIYMEEHEPLGTGGGIYQAITLADGPAYVLNGDTFFDVNLKELLAFYNENNADIALGLKRMTNFDRYGTVELSRENRIERFTEKQFLAEGLINGGVYVISKTAFSRIEDEQEALLPRKFSFEKDVLEKHINLLGLYGRVCDGYFIDIGIPQDYEQAQTDFATKFNQ